MALYSSMSEASGVHAMQRHINLFGRAWNIKFQSTNAFEAASKRHLTWLFSVGGIVLSISLFLLAHAQVRTTRINTSLYRAAAAGRREAEISLDINKRCMSTLDVNAVAQVVIEAGRELAGASYGVFIMMGDPTVKVRVFAETGAAPPAWSGSSLARLSPALSELITAQGVVRLADVRSSAALATSKVLPPEQPTSLLAAAIRSRSGELIGGLVYTHTEPDVFTADHERLIVRLATQAALAFDNAHLFKAEQEARRMAGRRAEDLAEANEELQQFIYVSSHDLQEPLRTITQYMDLLQRRCKDRIDSQATRYIDYASDSASRMYSLLNDLLTYSRIGREPERTQVPLAEICEEVSRDLQLLITEAQAVITFNRLPVIRCDRAKIRSLFQNLLGNALKFRGPVPPRITISAEADRTGIWTISISDNGIGIQPEYRETVFTLFHRLNDREAFAGTGIGLAICRKVVEQHGGRIWVTETPGGGCTFRFTLPEDGSGLNHVVKKP